MDIAQELNRIQGGIMEILADGHQRLTPQEFADQLNADLRAVETVLKSLFADRRVQAVYVYQLFSED